MSTQTITPRRTRPASLGMLCAIALTVPAFAQQAPASSASSMSDMSGMKMGAMPGMDMAHGKHGAPPAKPAAPARATSAQPAAAASSMGGMSGMDMGAMPGMEMKHGTHGAGTPAKRAAKPAAPAHPASASSSMGDMQGMDMSQAMDAPKPAPALPPGPADPTASLAKLEAMSMTGMDMVDNRRFGKVLINQLEATRADGVTGQAWDAYAGYGTDFNRLAIRSEGDRAGGRIEAASVEALWSHACATFWDSVMGVRHDFGNRPGRNWAAFGVQGLAPYGFDIEATGYVGAGGRTAARFKAEYELLITQRLILQPEFEANLYGKPDPAWRLGSGLSDASLGLRLRYEIRREFAPYIGVVWQRVFGGTAGFRRAENQSVFDRQLVAGVRIGF